MIKDAPDILTYKQPILDLLTPKTQMIKHILLLITITGFDRFFLQRMLRSFGQIQRIKHLFH